MKCALLGLCLGMFAGLGGCGGHVSRHGSPKVEAEAAGAFGSAGAPDDAGSAPHTAFGEPDTELGECVRGPRQGDPGTADHCRWLADGRCYEEREMACNCRCPRSHDSACVSGFDAGARGSVPVDCF